MVSGDRPDLERAQQLAAVWIDLTVNYPWKPLAPRESGAA
jgi:hypothetical protein